LNSEFVVIKPDYYNIKNIYTTEKTEYTYYDAKLREAKKITFPLLSNNMDNPSDLLKRIQKLMILNFNRFYRFYIQSFNRIFNVRARIK
jgi:hypothetical protein